MTVKQTFTVGISFLFCLIIFIPTVQADNGQMYEVGTDILEMRTAPEQNAEVAGELTRGDKLTIFQEKFDWVQTYYDGKEVWVASQYLIPINIEAQKDTDSEQNSNNNQKVKKASKVDSVAMISTHENKVERPRMIAESLEITQLENRNQLKNENDNHSLSGYHIVIDPGHGGKDAGAIAGRLNEKNITLSTAKLVTEKLQNEGATVTLTRLSDSYISLNKRMEISNAHSTDVFISLHYNAFSESTVGGIDTFYFKGGKGLQLAQSVQNSLTAHVNLNDRGAKPGNYYVLRENSHLAILVELGFITNPKERKKIQATNYQEKVSEGIVNGLKDYFKLEEQKLSGQP